MANPIRSKTQQGAKGKPERLRRPMLPGMSLEAVGNDGPRGMNAASPRATVGGAQNSAYSALSPADRKSVV